MKVNRWVAMVSLGGLVTVGTLVGTASSAAAVPTDCTVTNGGNWAQSFCASGTGQHRAVMVQRHFNPAVGLIACEGPWVPAGATSYAPCASQTVVSVRVETR